MIAKKIIALKVFLLSACDYPSSNQNVVKKAEGPTSEYDYSKCAFVWARELLPELSDDFEKALKDVQPHAKGYAEANGEDCVN